MIKYLEKDFKEEIKDKVILVDFYADWCYPCKIQGEILNTVKDIDILKVNIEQHRELAEEYNVMSIPYLIIFKNNKIIKKHVGLLNITELNEFIKTE